MRKAKLLRKLVENHGKPPDVDYYDEDMRGIRAYADHRKENGLDPFHVDDTTWNDLSLDSVFQRVNSAHSTAGEQTLYAWLRCPAMNTAQFEDRRSLTDLIERDAVLRLELQHILARLGKWRAAYTREAFTPATYHSKVLLIIILLVAALVSSIAALRLSGLREAVPAMVFFMVVNTVYHSYTTRKMERDLATVNYSVAMAWACKRMLNVRHSALQQMLSPLKDAVQRCRPLMRMGGVSFATQNDLATMLNGILMVDLFSYEMLKRRLGRYHKEIFTMQEEIGKIDAAITIASYRRSIETWCTPEVDFSEGAKPFFSMEGMAHPLLSYPVLSSVETQTALLVTGSNASGKSTFLKACALCALLSQSLCTAPTKRYSATSFRVYSSMAIADDMLTGESYFIAEIKSLKRIWDAVERSERVLCVIDEVLRGTNTVERIAASSEILMRLNRENVLCFVATHDIELCALLSSGYKLLHFTEQIENNTIHFDYLVREGHATSRNAIRLLSLMGFDNTVTDSATKRGEGFERTGRWER